MPKFTFQTNATADLPDSRDYIYEPSLTQISPIMDSPNVKILNQGSEGACTGFSLAAVINFLNAERESNRVVSPRMLYEMARKNDEWDGEDYSGSSLRGAIKGWKNMGVCSEEEWPYRLKGGLKHLTISAAKDARNTAVGAYYRLLPKIAHFHNALNVAGAIAVSARVHKGWRNPTDGIIKKSSDFIGGHAFVIIGYNAEGFIVQNSWGKQWGDNGTALWSYEDWIETVMDAWVISLALPTPDIFGKKALSYKTFNPAENETAELFGKSVDRVEIEGHFVHIDDGKYHDSGRYWSNAEDVEQTAELVGKSSKYDHLVFYFHGGLNSPKDSAHRVKSMKGGFKRNRIYPYHIMYDTGLAEELKDIIFRKGKASQDRVGGISDISDRFLESLLRRPGTLLWEEMKNDAEQAFESGSAGRDILSRFIKHLQKASGKKKKIHLIGHSTGGIVIAHLLRALQGKQVEIASCSLLAPAASLDLFDSHYLPIIQNKKKLRIKKLNIYNLKDHLEKDDTVGKVYRKSLLYLVSNSFERKGRGTSLLGMEKFEDELKFANGKPVLFHSNGRTGTTTVSKTHGGFDNDYRTMNHVLKNIIGKKAVDPFTPEELK